MEERVDYVIRINKIEDTLQGSTVQLFLIHGVYSEDVEKGWMEITNFLIMEHVLIRKE